VKKSQLRQIIKESIKDLITEQPQWYNIQYTPCGCEEYPGAPSVSSNGNSWGNCDPIGIFNHYIGTSLVGAYAPNIGYYFAGGGTIMGDPNFFLPGAPYDGFTCGGSTCVAGMLVKFPWNHSYHPDPSFNNQPVINVIGEITSVTTYQGNNPFDLEIATNGCPTTGCIDPMSLQVQLYGGVGTPMTPYATTDDGSCVGCPDPAAPNYCASCVTRGCEPDCGTYDCCCSPVIVYGCMDPTACNSDCDSSTNPGSFVPCQDGVTFDDGSCVYNCDSYDCDSNYQCQVNTSGIQAGQFNGGDSAQNLAACQSQCTQPPTPIEGCADSTATPCSQMPPALQNSIQCYEANHDGCGNPPDFNDTSCCLYQTTNTGLSSTKKEKGCADPTAVHCLQQPGILQNNLQCYDPVHGGCDGNPLDPTDTSCCLYEARDRDLDRDPPGPCDEFTALNTSQQKACCRKCLQTQQLIQPGDPHYQQASLPMVGCGGLSIAPGPAPANCGCCKWYGLEEGVQIKGKLLDKLRMTKLANAKK
jgi:hypothetical protein